MSSITATQIRVMRRSLGIPGTVVSARAGICRSRLSDIEQELVTPRPEELQRLEQALTELNAAKSQLRSLAATLGWPNSLI